MYLNAIRPPGDAALGGRTLAYGAALDGLKGFDTLNAALRSRQDAIQRATVSAAAAYPQPGFGSVIPGGAALAGAVSAYAGSEAGRAKIESFASAAGGFFGRLFGSGGPEQLLLPLEV